MSAPEFELQLIPRPGWLHAIVTGRNSREAVLGYLQALLRECQARGCERLLVEERLEGPRLSTIAVFTIVESGSADAAEQFSAIAFVDVNAAGGLMDFAETVAVNRGLRLHHCATVAQAEAWLTAKVAEAGRQHRE